ncbi:aminotransferase class IV [Streptomyces sp. JNUCC 64]
MALLDGRPATPEELLALGLTNYGHFTSLRVDGGRVRGLPLHLDRLVRDCRTVFGAALDRDAVLRHVRRATEGLTGSFVVRITVLDPATEPAAPSKATDPHVLVTTRPAPAPAPPPLRALPLRYERDVPAVKHVGLFGLLHTRRAAQLRGYDDALFTGPGDRISEGGTWNVGFVDPDGTVVWPDAEVLPGVTMALLRDLTPSVTRPLTLAEARSLPAAFATNAAFGVRPLSAIGDTPLTPDHPALIHLRDAYLALRGEEL